MDKRKLITVFEAAADTWPENQAVTAADATLNYRELDCSANAIANCCAANGIGHGKIAAIVIPNSAAYIAAMLGVMKAGAVFMPVDPNAPFERQKRIFLKARPDIVITVGKEREPVGDFLIETQLFASIVTVTAQTGPVSMFTADSNEQIAVIPDTSRPSNNLDPDDDLYIMFTSGTTGTPKAILGQRKSLAHFIHWEKTEFAFDESLRASNLAPTTFDVSLRDIFAPLSSGGMVAVPEEDIKSSPAALLDWIVDNSLTLVHIVPSMFRLLLEELEKRPEPQDLLSSLKYIMLAGEAVYGRDVMRFQAIAKDTISLVNLYGPSETTLAKLFLRLDFPPDNPGQIMPLGSPISNTAVIILKNGRLAEIGEIGEIHIKTPFRSKGYFKDPEKSADSFIVNPLSGDPEDIIYRSGDMGRYREDRSVEFAGRLDRQVKVNGVRIELSEVDEAVNSMPGIKEAHVMPYKLDDTGEMRLICYYTEEQELETALIREFIATSLYSAMIPSYFVRMDKFPLGINGKINYRSLPKPDEIIYENRDYTAPESETEKRIAEIWSEILGIRKISVTIPFNLLGGGSMQAIRCVGSIAREFNVEIRLHDFIDAATVKTLAAFVDSQKDKQLNNTIPRQPERPDYPATNAQLRLWTLQNMLPGFTAYNIAAAFRVTGDLNEDILEKAIGEVVNRHDILHTVFFERAGVLRQRLCTEHAFRLDRFDHMETAEMLSKQADRYCQTVFDLEKGPLLRATLMNDSEGTLLFFVMHHIIGDAWSLDLILNETLTVYQAMVSGGDEIPLSEPKLQYRDFAAWQNERLENGAFDSQGNYWRKKLSGELPRLDLPLDMPRPSRKSYQGATFYYTFPAVILEKKQRYARESGHSLFSLLISTLRTLIYRITGQNEIILNTPLTLRGQAELEQIPGDFTNSVLLRALLQDSMPFSELAKITAEELGQAIANRDYPFDLIAPDLIVENDLSRAPFSDIGITLVEDFNPGGLPATGLQFEPFELETGISKYDMVFHFSLSGGSLTLIVEYDAAIFRESRIRRMTDCFFTLMDNALSDPDTALSELTLLSPGEQALLKRFQFPRERNYSDSTIHGAFERIVSDIPDAPALVLPDASTMSFAELDRASNRIATMLLDNGVENGDPVAVFMPRSYRIPITILGILKSGAVYVPLAQELPPDRIAYMLGDCGASIVLTDAVSTDKLPASCRTIDISTAERHPDETIQAAVEPTDSAYIIYTSGSTGIPKGVLLPHLGLVNRARELKERADITPADRFTQFASLSFDASLYEIFCSLLNGASLVVADQETIEDVTHFRSFLTSMQVTFTLLPPSYLHSLGQREFPGIRVLKTAGEAANVDDACYYARQHIYINGYGPTEDSICSSIFIVDPNRDYPFGIPIGDPVGDTEALVLDNKLNPLPVGVPGQLAVSDNGLALGYINKPELTDKFFVQHPFNPGKRLYLTGDLVRWDENGDLLFHGRMDYQVKINGHRIELGELENVMRIIDGVDDAAVITYGEAGKLRLAAFFTGNAETSEIVKEMHSKLPLYMHPHVLKRLDTMPMTASGKIDRKALPDPAEHDSVSIKEAESEEERVLIAACASLLGVETLSADANFFASGGDSIRAIQAVARLYEQGWSLTVADFFENPVISDLAAVMQRSLLDCAGENVTGTIAPTPILRWFRETVTARPGHFNQSVLLKSSGTIDLNALNKSLGLLWSQHDALRMVMKADTFEILDDNTLIHPECIDLTDTADWHSALAEQSAEVQACFDPAQGPLLKVVLFRTPDGDRLFLCAHHIIIDAVSWRIIARDLESFYTENVKGKSPAVPLKSTSFRSWAAHLASLASSGTFEDELPYWREIVTTECDNFGVRKSHGIMQTLTANVTGDVVDTIAGSGDGKEIQARMLAALAAALARFKGMTRIRILLEGHGRNIGTSGPDVSRTVGWFTAAWPFLLDCGEDMGEVFGNAHRMLKDIPHAGVGYGILRYCAGHEELAVTPEISFNYLGRTDLNEGMFAIANEDSGETVSPENNMGYTLELMLSVDNDTLTVNMSYDSNSINENDAAALIARYKECLMDSAACQAAEYDFSDFGEGGLDGFLENL